MPDCPICQRETQEELVYPADVVVTTEIRTQNPSWKEADGVCPTCVAEYEKRLQG
ncbi:MAG: hypothetical protein V3U86_03890 [Acidobacteriota bacterium]|nr:hypothetical protein [Acidobacteriota bacterium]